jgi:hypothetical protein
MLACINRSKSARAAAALILVLLLKLGMNARAGDATSVPIDLRGAHIFVPDHPSGIQKKSIDLLIDEISARTRLRLPVTSGWPTNIETPVIVISTVDQLKTLPGGVAGGLAAENQQPRPEGFRIRTEATKGRAPVILVVGDDSRGVLFGIGKLLRSVEMSRDRIGLRAPLEVTTAPAMPIRGHQLGYRPKTNSYDAWGLSQWEQYIRDLAVFGCNSIELIPPRSDDDSDSPHFPLPQMEMMIGVSRIAADYGLDVWIWYPAMEPGYSTPAAIEAAVKEWGDVLSKLPRVDALFVPTGDPGDAPPAELMAMLAAQAKQLKQIHPKARIWVSMQSFTEPQFNEMRKILEQEPEWLGGVVHGPQTRISVAKLREIVPRRYPIRGYPDITHSMRCEYAVPEWDLAYALTEGREVINPRPLDESTIFQLYKNNTRGVITYSEGCNDDVNKLIWSSLCWDPNASITDILHDYSRYFIGDKYTGDFSEGLLALERNWRGPLRANEAVKVTLQKFRDMERAAEPRTLRNWRFQQALYRATYDAYERQRLIKESAQESEAMKVLQSARQIGSTKALDGAEAILDRADARTNVDRLEARVNELAEALFQSIGMQLSVEKYRAIEVGRGANLDELNVPLNNRAWLKGRFAALRKLSDEAAILQGIDEVVHWTDPGPGGYYDDLGDPSNQPHLVRSGSYAKDPGFLETPFIGFSAEPSWRRSWCTHVDGRYQTPIMMHYRDLDPGARYKIRVVYAGDNFEAPVRLVALSDSANKEVREIEVHPFMSKPQPIKPIEFAIPKEATSGGELKLIWRSDAIRGHAGRGCQIAEVWLIKVPTK